MYSGRILYTHTHTHTQVGFNYTQISAWPIQVTVARLFIFLSFCAFWGTVTILVYVNVFWAIIHLRLVVRNSRTSASSK